MLPPRSAPRARRRSPALALALTARVGPGAADGATFIFSSRAQDLTRDFSSRFEVGVRASGIGEVGNVTYRRGFAESTQSMTVTLQPGGTERPVVFLVTNRIQHGPFPGLRSVGQAVVNTEVRLADPQLQAQLDRAFGGKEPVVRTVVGFDGGTNTRIEVPAARLTEAGTTLASQPLTGNVRVAGGRTETALSWPGLSVQSPEGQAEIGGVRVSATSRRSGAEDPLGVGQGSFTVDRLNFSGGGEAVRLSGLKVGSESRLSGPAHYDALVRYDLGELAVAGKTLRDVQLHLGVRHLAREPLGRLMTLVNELQADAAREGAGATPALTEAQAEQVRKDVLALLRGEPKLTVDRLSLRQPSGDITVTGEVGMGRAASLPAEELEMLSAMPQMLATMLSVRLDARASENALGELLALFGEAGGQDLSGAVQDLVDAGYVRRSGGQLSAQFSLQDGQPLLNGQALGE